MNIQAVAFDVDGTLYPSWQMALGSIHLLFSHPRLLFAFSRTRKEIRRIRPIEDFRMVQARLVADKLHMDLQETLAIIDEKMYEAWKTSFRNIRPFRGLKDTILWLKDQGLKLAVMSDFPVERKLVYLGLDGLWTLVCTSESTGYLKPHPEPFLKLAGDLGLPPERILYIGNSYRYDVVGARNAGMYTACLTRRKRSGIDADIVFSRYGELLGFFQDNLLQTGDESGIRIGPAEDNGSPRIE